MEDLKNFKEGVIGDCVEAEVCGNEVLKRFLSFIKPKVEVKEIFNKLFTLWEERCGEPSREELENLQRDLLELPMSHQMGQQHQWDGEGIMAVSCSREPRQNDDFAAMNEEMERQWREILKELEIERLYGNVQKLEEEVKTVRKENDSLCDLLQKAEHKLQVKSDYESKEKAEKLQKVEDHYGQQLKTLKTEYDILKETNVKCKETIQQLHKELEQEHAQNVDLSSLYIRLASANREHVQQCKSCDLYCVDMEARVCSLTSELELYKNKVAESEESKAVVRSMEDQLNKTREELEVKLYEAEREKGFMASKATSMEEQMMKAVEECKMEKNKMEEKYKQKIAEMKKDATEQERSMEDQLNKTREELEVKLYEAEREKGFMASKATSMEEQMIKAVEECKKEKNKMEEKYKQVVTKVGKLISELKDEKEFNRCLVQNQTSWKEKLKETEAKLQLVEAEKKDLEEQLADVIRHLEAQKAIERLPDGEKQELEGGQLFVGEGSSHQRKKKSRRKR